MKRKLILISALLTVPAALAGPELKRADAIVKKSATARDKAKAERQAQIDEAVAKFRAEQAANQRTAK